MALRETNIMFQIIDGLLDYAEHFIKKNDMGITPKEFDIIRHDATACFVPLIRWSKPLISYQNLHDTTTNQTIWSSIQTMRFAVGASFVSIRYRKFLSDENLEDSVTAKAYDKYQIGILDDIVDRGNYNYQEARQLYRHVISNMTSHDFDGITFQEELNSILNPGQMGISDAVTSIASGFSTFFFEAPRADEVIPLMKKLDERMIEGSALTVLQKEDYLDLEKIKGIAKDFYSPEDGLRWYEKLANYISGGIRYNLIDIAYSDDGFDRKDLDNIFKAWYFYDIIMVFLNNIVDLKLDLQNGIYNLSLVDMKDEDISSVDKDDPHLTPDDYERHLSHNAELARKALKYVEADEENRKFYLFITMMIPLIMMADWVGKNDEMIESLLGQIY